MAQFRTCLRERVKDVAVSSLSTKSAAVVENQQVLARGRLTTLCFGNKERIDGQCVLDHAPNDRIAIICPMNLLLVVVDMVLVRGRTKVVVGITILWTVRCFDR